MAAIWIMFTRQILILAPPIHTKLPIVKMLNSKFEIYMQKK